MSTIFQSLSNRNSILKKNAREKLLEQAEILFSRQGFYGTSINDVARELNISKQGLLHHFSTKEKLCGEVLQGAADCLKASLTEAKATSEVATEQLAHFLKNMSSASDQSLRVIILLMRELLDNRDRAEKAHKWYLRPFLDELVTIVESAQTQGQLTKVSPLAFVYQLLRATQYFLISQPTLQQLYSEKELAEHQKQHFALFEKMLS